MAERTEELFSKNVLDEGIKCGNLLQGIQGKLKHYFCNFRKIDTFLYPLDYWAGLSEKQLIETHRISPEDAKLGLSSSITGSRLEKKIAGDSLNAFGGFFKKS